MRILAGARNLRAVPMLSLAAVLAGSAVAACGSNSAGAAGTGLCDNVPQVDRLVIKRVNHFPQNHNRFTFPVTVTVSDRRQAQAVARAACALPPMPTKGTIACPFDWGVIYRLSFAVDGTKPSALRVNPSGCREVSGLSPARWTLRSPAFWRLLAEVMGIGPPTESTFAGI